jgi:hypothetical protein
MFMEKSTAMEDLHGQMGVHTQDNLKKTIFKVREHTIGLMDVNSSEHGSTIKWKVQVFLHGLMEENTMESI